MQTPRQVSTRRATSDSPRAWLWTFLLLGSIGNLASCSSVEPVAPAAAPITDPAQLYMRLTLDHPAVTLSTAPGYQTLQLTATPRDALGNPMEGLPAPIFTSLDDTTKVKVTPGGLVSAIGTASAPGLRVIATLTVGSVTHKDTALIQVTELADPPMLDTLSIYPLRSDDAVWSIPAGRGNGLLFQIFWETGIYTIPRVMPRTVTAIGSPIPGLLIEYASLDQAVATVGRRTGLVTLLRPGQVRIVAQAAAYGSFRADTATFTVTMPATNDFIVYPNAAGDPSFVAYPTEGLLLEEMANRGLKMTNEVRIVPFGIVSWSNRTNDVVDVVFDDPVHVVLPPAYLCDDLVPLYAELFGFPLDACGEGNMILSGMSPDPNILPGFNTVRFRQFPEPGVYPFHSARTGATGRVVVTTDPE